MGCGGSKIDDLPLVIRCRARKDLIKSAMDYRYDLSSSHVAYFQSLKDVGDALCRFVDEELVVSSSSASSPVLTLPSDEGKTSSSVSRIHSIDDNHDSDSDSDLHDLSSGSESDLHSSFGSHIHIVDDHSVEGNERKSPFYPHYNHNQPNWDNNFVMNGGPPPGDPYGINSGPSPYQFPSGPSGWAPYGGVFHNRGNPNFYYMKKSAPASNTVVHKEERGFQRTGQWPDPSEYNPNLHANGRFYGFSMNASLPPEEIKQHNPAKTPSPPPPPKVSGWDFLNFFDEYENGYKSYGYGFGSVVSSPDIRELREREGIPDLEEETEYESEEVKLDTKRTRKEGSSKFVPKENIQVNSSQNSGTGSSKRNSEGTSNKSKEVKLDTNRSKKEGSVPKENNEANSSQSSGSKRNSEGSSNTVPSHSIDIEVDISIHTVSESSGEKKEVSFEVDSPILSSLRRLSPHDARGLQEVFNDIKNEFEIAFGFGKELSVILEAEKVPYRQKSSVLKVALSRILYPFLSSLQKQSVNSRVQTTDLARSYYLDAVTSISISSTLEKLYTWEKKLYKQVKDEERLRLKYDNSCEKLKDLDERGAEYTKIDGVRASVQRNQTKLNVCIKTIDAIAMEIQKVRDEELQPQLSELIYRLTRMWKLMVKCHRKQLQAIESSRNWNLKANVNPRSENATLVFEIGVLLTWCKQFEDWINAQKSFVNSLNAWLHECIDHKPQVTADGNIPFSPGRIGAPPIFIICNDWDNGLKRVSKQQISTATAIRGLASNLRQLLERRNDEQYQRLKAKQLAKEFSDQRENLRIEASETGFPTTDDRKEELRLMREKTEEARERHKESVKSVHDAASMCVKEGLIGVLKALVEFSSDAFEAHKQVRLQNQRQFA